jgi:hypothetical protein
MSQANNIVQIESLPYVQSQAACSHTKASFLLAQSGEK